MANQMSGLLTPSVIQGLIQQRAIEGGILSPEGQIMPAPQKPAPNPGGFQGLLQSPGLSQALLSAASSMGMANERGMGFGSMLAAGAGSFGGTLQQEKDRITQAEKEATRERLAAMKDIIGLKSQQEEMALRMQAASLTRRAQQDALDSRSQEKAEKEARRQAVYASGDPDVIKAYEMFGDDAAQSLYIDSRKPKAPNTQGLPEGYQWGPDGTAVPIAGITPTGLKPTDTARKEADLAREALDAMADFKAGVFDPDGSVNRWAVNTGMASTQGRDVLQPLETAIGNTVYLKTGAAATPGEIESLMKQYAPSRLDTKEQVERKAKSLEQFLTSKAPDYQPTGNRAKAPNAQSGFKVIGVE